MCLPLDKIKFCTCITDVTKLENYWVVYRKKRGNKNLIFIVGEPIFMYDKMKYLNMGVIEDRLSEPDAFDVEISFKNKDVLSLVLNNNSENQEDTLFYDFEYIKGKWSGLDRSPFDLKKITKNLQMGKLRFNCEAGYFLGLSIVLAVIFSVIAFRFFSERKSTAFED